MNFKNFCLATRVIVQNVESAAPECRQDSDCPSQHGCINKKCQNPCIVENVCSVDQECRVLDTIPIRSIMCQCPSDFIADKDGRCRPIGKYLTKLFLSKLKFIQKKLSFKILHFNL